MEAIDDCALEFPGRNTLLKEEVELSVSSALWFRKTEVSPDETDEVKTAPEEASLSSPVKSGRVHESRLNNADDDTKNVVYISG